MKQINDNITKLSLIKIKGGTFMKKGALFLVFLLLATLFLSACSGSNGSGAGGAEPQGEGSNAQTEQTFVTIATGNSGGVFFALGGVFAELFNSIDGVVANAQSTEGSVINVSLVNEHKADIGFTNSSVSYYGANGMEMFKQKQENVYAIAELYPMYQHFVATEASGISAVPDLKGKKIAVGPKGSGTEVLTRQMLEGWGVSYDDFEPSYISFTNAVDQMKNGTLDGAFIATGIPTAAVTDLMTSVKAKLVPLEKATVEKLSETYPFFQPGVIPAGYYPGQEEEVETLTIGTTLVVNKKLDDDLVYEITKTIYENLDRIKTAHSAGKDIVLEQAPAAGKSIPLHPGAKRYYEEKGLVIPQAGK